jgi:hypothetical protein
MIKVTLPKGKDRCLYFDTEQSTYDVSMVLKRCLKVSGTDAPKNFEAFGLRALDPQGRLLVIEQKIYNTPDLGLIVIDGIRDLIYDINRPEEATMIASKLLKWTEERDIHIIVVLHQNKGDNNARGHLGAEIVNKAESVISVEKDNEVSVVKPEYVRGKDFSSFAFSIDSSGIPYIIPGWIDGKPTEKKVKNTPFDYSPEEHLEVLQTIFKNGKKHKYADLLTEISLGISKDWDHFRS